MTQVKAPTLPTVNGRKATRRMGEMMIPTGALVALAGAFEALVVIAAPRTLGEPRKQWRKPLEGKLVAEIARDLTGRTPERIAAAISRA